jgi:hypothetical protein
MAPPQSDLKLDRGEYPPSIDGDIDTAGSADGTSGDAATADD